MCGHSWQKPLCPAVCTGTVRWVRGWPSFDALTCSVSLLLLPKGYSRQARIRWTWIKRPDEDKQGEVQMKPILRMLTGCRLSGTCPELRCLPGPRGARPSGYTWADAAVGWGWSVPPFSHCGASAWPCPGVRWAWSVWHPSHTVGCQPGPGPVRVWVRKGGMCHTLCFSSTKASPAMWHKVKELCQSSDPTLWPQRVDSHSDLTLTAYSASQVAEKGHARLKPKCAFFQLFPLEPEAVSLTWARIQLEITNVITL